MISQNKIDNKKVGMLCVRDPKSLPVSNETNSSYQYVLRDFNAPKVRNCY